MRFIFFQNCISPHQMPYIEALSRFPEVAEVCVVVPRITYGERAQLGWPEEWTQERGKLHVMLKPFDYELVVKFSQAEHETSDPTVALFSGISAFPEVKHWFLMSLEYRRLVRCIITEAPYTRGLAWMGWLHRLHFLLTDYRYIHSVQYVFAIGEDCVNYYRSWSKHWQVVPFMYCTRPLGRSRSLPVLPKESPLKLLFVGSLEPRKNVQALLKALRKADFDYEFSIVGSGPLRDELAEKARDWQVKVNFVDAVPNAQIHRLMASYDLLVLPSLHDGWGAVINEAATVGTLTACSHQCGARVIANFVFDAGKPQQLTDILHEVSAQLTRLRAERKQRIDWAAGFLAPERVAHMMFDRIYKRCIEGEADSGCKSGS